MGMAEAYKRKKMSEGGDVKGVHAPMLGGQSDAGHYVRDAANIKDKHGREMTENAKGEHRRVLGEIRSMPRPNLYYKGGKVDPGDDSGCAAHGMASCQTCDEDRNFSNTSSSPGTTDTTSGAYAMGGMVDRVMKKKYPEKDMDTADGEEAHEPDGPSVEDPEPEDERDDMIGRIMKKRAGGK